MNPAGVYTGCSMMNNYKTIEVNPDGPVGTVTLNRPEILNAINLEMIREITAVVKGFEKQSGLRVIVFRSNGDHFSSGADLNWMQEGMTQTNTRLTSESLELAKLFETISYSSKVTVSAVHGRSMGGANGIVAASDIVIADDTAIFAFSEVKLGLIPATISPYVLRKIGSNRTRELMLTGRRFDAIEAYESGLVHKLCKPGGLDDAVKKLTDLLLSNGPAALTGVKELIRFLEDNPDSSALPAKTARLIARFRLSEEGQEGMKAFLEKRKPDWIE